MRRVSASASSEVIIGKLKLMADAPGGLFMLDKEIGLRVFTPPVAE